MSFRYPAGLITADSPINANYPSGVWTPMQAYPYIANNVWGQDPYFNQTTLLLHGDGTNGAQNNTFLDSSTNNFTITRNGNTTQGTFSPFSLAEGEWSNYFDGTGDCLSLANNAAFNFGSDPFTIEAWVYFNTLSPAAQAICSNYGSGSTGFTLQTVNANITANFSGDGTDISGSTTLTVGRWYHIALSGTPGATGIKLFLDGVQEGSTYTGAVSLNTSASLVVGGLPFSGSFVNLINGYISNIRLVKGTAVYTSNFTPPTAPLTAITNTSLLTCQSNRFVDNSTNNFTITRNGDVKVTAFSPFQPTQAYSPTVTGGSGYFDGSGDYLSIASPTTDLVQWYDTDFTIEAWVYPFTFTGWSAGDAPSMVGNMEATGGVVNWSFGLMTNGTVRFFYSTGSARNVSTTASAVLYSWNHIAMVKNSSGIKVFLNGVGTSYAALIMTPTYSTGTTFVIGSFASTAINGMVSGLRVVKGTSVYDSDFTPPTAPPTAITNTQLLTNFTNAGILDNANKNNLETVGNAQIDTSIVKYGTGSMEFDGTGDYLVRPYSQDVDLNAGDFTIEAWVYPTASNVFSTVASMWNTAGSESWILNINSGTLGFAWRAFSSSINLLETGSVSLNQWSHIAIVRSGNTFTSYLNGVSQASATSSNNTPVASLIIGAYANGASGNYQGFIDDLRITKGVARYIANFTPPIARMPNQ